MAPNKNRYRDIVYAPCNRSVERRNTAAIRDSLEGLVNDLENIDQGDSSSSAGSTIIFFLVIADAVGADSVAVTELVYNGGSGDWEPTGGSYTAHDWSPSGRFNKNFSIGHYGLGRLNTDVASDALEVISIEGKARFVQGTLAEDMGATITKQANTTITQFWGNDPNGVSPGSPITIYDISNMAPEAKNGDICFAMWDEKRTQYIYIGPWNGPQTPGSTTIVRCNGGDSLKGCDSSSTEGTYCVHSGKIQTITVLGDFCTEKFTDGASCWILDARNCHANSRLGNNERYVAVSAGIPWDPDPMGPGTDERALYYVVDYAPAFRWFRILTDVESVAANDETNDLQCRQTDCGGMQDDDAPSAWGKWEDIDPCTRVLTVLDPTSVLVYFPMHRGMCDPAIATSKEECIAGDNNPECRKNRHVLCFWNPVAERWDAVQDARECEGEQDVSLIYVCDENIEPDCCVYDSLRIKFFPNGESYCDSEQEFEPVWLKCNKDAVLVKGFCDLGVRICDALTCNGDTRPVYLAKCANCSDCECPDFSKSVTVTVRVGDKDGDCGYMDGITEKLYCFDRNPFLVSPGSAKGFAGILEFQGLRPRVLWAVPIKAGNDPPYVGNVVWLEIAGYGDPGYSPGDIMNAWADPGVGDFVPVAKPSAAQYDVISPPGIYDCFPLILSGEHLSRVVDLAYGVWVECNVVSGELTNAQLFWLNPNYTTSSPMPACSGGAISRTIIGAPATDVFAGPEDLQVELVNCCANRMLACPGDLDMGCDGSNPDVTITVEDIGDSMNICRLEGGFHFFGGCPCSFVGNGTGANCSRSSAPCSSAANEICFEFYWSQ